MMQDTTDITQMPTAGGSVNAPTSGTYGEKASLERLKQSFPTAQQPTDAPPQANPMPQPGTGAGISNSPAPGVPQSIMAPTQRPDIPVNTPLLAPVNPMVNAQTNRQKRLVVLDALENGPNVSDQTREWAQLYRRQLIET